MTLNPDLVRTRCSEIAESVERLQQIRELGAEAFLAVRDTRDIACYRLLIAIEASLALCYHVSARRVRQTPEDYAACFTVLEQAAIIPAQLAERLRRMARFRQHLDDLTELSRLMAQLV